MQFYFLKTKVNLSFSFWAVVTLMLMLDRSNTAIITLISAVLHETGHLIMMYAFSAPPEKLTLGFFGMRIDKRESSLSFLKETIVALAGPIVNLIIALVSFVFYKFYCNEQMLKISTINLMLGLFNLIPIEPLDGARAIKNTLSMFLDEQCIDKILNSILWFFLILLYWLSIKVINLSGYNFTLLIFCIYISLCIIFKRR